MLAAAFTDGDAAWKVLAAEILKTHSGQLLNVMVREVLPNVGFLRSSLSAVGQDGYKDANRPFFLR
jgi:hypothetical protein